MKLTLRTIAFALALFIASSAFVVPISHAQTAVASSPSFTFKKDLSWGMWENPDVAVMQQFLANQGFYKGPITGNFMDKTYTALVAFQKKEGIKPASGYFGPLTRADANTLLPYQGAAVAATAMRTATPVLNEMGKTFTGYLEARAGAAFNTIMQWRNWWMQPKKASASGVTVTTTPVTTGGTSSGGGVVSGGGGGGGGGGSIPSGTTANSGSTGSTATTTATTTQSTGGGSNTGGGTGTSTSTPATSTPQTGGNTGGNQGTTTPPVSTTTPQTFPPAPSGISWGAYVGDNSGDLATFESLVGKPVKIQAYFVGWGDDFPASIGANLKSANKTLLIFWEPNVGYDAINSGSEDAYMNQFAAAAKSYGAPIILAPFDEMNLNETAWGYGKNGNTAAKFVTAWKHVHDLFAAASAGNVKFAIAYNNGSVPNVSGNGFNDYYPGDAYVDYVGVDGFNFGNPWQSFDTIFSSALNQLKSYNKPIYIFSMASVPGTQKAAWITDALATQMVKYPVAGWVWFNQNGADGNWLVNTDAASLAAFKAAIPN